MRTHTSLTVFILALSGTMLSGVSVAQERPGAFFERAATELDSFSAADAPAVADIIVQAIDTLQEAPAAETRQHRDNFVKALEKEAGARVNIQELETAVKENREGIIKAFNDSGVEKVIDVIFEEGKRRLDDAGEKININDDGLPFFGTTEKEEIVATFDVVKEKLEEAKDSIKNAFDDLFSKAKDEIEDTLAEQKDDIEDTIAEKKEELEDKIAEKEEVTPLPLGAINGHIVDSKGVAAGPDESGDAAGSKTTANITVTYTQNAPSAADPETWVIPTKTTGYHELEDHTFTDGLTGDAVIMVSQGGNVAYFHGKETDTDREFSGILGRPIGATESMPDSGYEFFRITPELHITSDSYSPGVLANGFETIHDGVLPDNVNVAALGNAPVIADWNTGRLLGTSILWNEDVFGAQGIHGSLTPESDDEALSGEFISFLIGAHSSMEEDDDITEDIVDTVTDKAQELVDDIPSKDDIVEKVVTVVEETVNELAEDIPFVGDLISDSVTNLAEDTADKNAPETQNTLSEAVKDGIEDIKTVLDITDDESGEHPDEGVYFGEFAVQNGHVFGTDGDVEGFIVKGQDTLSDEEDTNFRIKNGLISTEKSPAAFGDELAGTYSATEGGFAAAFAGAEIDGEDSDDGAEFDAFYNYEPEDLTLTKNKDDNDGRGSVGINVTVYEYDSNEREDSIHAKLGSNNPDDHPDGNLYLGKNTYGIGQGETLVRTVDNEVQVTAESVGFATGANPLNSDVVLCNDCEHTQWGVWAHAAEHTVTDEDGSVNVFEAMVAPFVSGAVTQDLADISRTGTADYSGGIMAQVLDGNDITAAVGNFNASIDMDNRTITDFTAEMADRTFGFEGGAHAIAGAGDAFFHEIAVGQLDSGNVIEGHLNGALFGPDASDIAGNFVTEGGLDSAGIYQGTEDK